MITLIFPTPEGGRLTQGAPALLWAFGLTSKELVFNLRLHWDRPTSRWWVCA